ncbi:MAG: methylated-DNA--[protein]-cysteine S-methyltransferase [Anaerohalosphaeraceae bacterium]|jgi:methylated-DNA-[protein]-cysteine S-methyltransferase
MDRAYINTPLGTALIEGSEAGITRVTIGPEVPESKEIPASLVPVCRQLKAYFEGQLKEFDVHLYPEGTTFQKKVWQRLTEIPFGSTISYGELAASLGNHGAVRAVASANAQNPIWVLIPCHRVVGADGDLRGYAGGLHRKQWLLNHESEAYQYSLFSGRQKTGSDM